MANFSAAFEGLKQKEGFYVNDKNDLGGETFLGISRKYHPFWKGWTIVDKFEDKAALKFEKQLIGIAKTFYAANFWNKLFLDAEIIPQRIGEKIFYMSVNLGIETTVLYLQIALNVLNERQQKYINIKQDGIFGQETMSTFKIALSKVEHRLILNVLNIFHGSHLIDSMLEYEGNEKYTIGWLNRITVIEK